MAKLKTYMAMVELTSPTNRGMARFKPGSTLKTDQGPPSYKWADVTKYEDMDYREILEAVLKEEFGLEKGKDYFDETRNDRLQHWFIEKSHERLEIEKKENLMAYAESIDAEVHPAWASWQIVQAIEKKEAEIYAKTKKLPEKKNKGEM